MKQKINKWAVWYFDTWGNAEDGWEVNNQMQIGEISIIDGASDADIIQRLKDDGWIKEEEIYLEDFSENTIDIILAKDDCPIGKIVRA